MPSPFPGMDPWLESAARWRATHAGMGVGIAYALNRLLPARYAASAGERVYVLEESRSIYPDVAVVERREYDPAAETSVGVLTADPSIVVTVEPEEVRETYVEVLLTDGSETVVAHIEVLSPANKTPGPNAQGLYRQKQKEVLSSTAHLIEIDLLRRGIFTVAVPEAEVLDHGPHHYITSLHRADREDQFEFWSWSVRERLPRISIPLADDEEDVVLDLQAVLDECYDRAAFAKLIDYRTDPPPPAFEAQEREWIEARLREAGMR